MILEIGTGKTNKNTFLNHENVIHVDLDPECHHLETLCDTHKLPFKNNMFNTVYCAHVLEHCINPYRVLNEMRRVSKNNVIIKIPNISYNKSIDESEQHIYSWSQSTLKRLLKKVFSNVEIENTHLIRPNSLKFYNLFYWIKLIFLKKFLGNNELTAYCKK